MCTIGDSYIIYHLIFLHMPEAVPLASFKVTKPITDKPLSLTEVMGLVEKDETQTMRPLSAASKNGGWEVNLPANEFQGVKTRLEAAGLIVVLLGEKTEA